MGFFGWPIAALYQLGINIGNAILGARKQATQATAWQQAVMALISWLDKVFSLIQYVTVMNAYAVNRLARAAEYSAQGTLNTFKWFADVAIPVFVYNVVGTETAERRAAIAGVIAKEERDILTEYNERRKAIHDLMQWVDDSAAKDGYDPTLKQVAHGLAGTLGQLAGNEHVDQRLLDLTIKLLVRLATLDIPELRPEIERLVLGILKASGIDRDLASVISSQLNALLGWKTPKTLADTTREIGERLNALEETVGQLAGVLEPLKGESRDLKELGSAGFDAALLAYLTAAVARPEATARDTADALTPVTAPLMASIRRILDIPR